MITSPITVFKFHAAVTGDTHVGFTTVVLSPLYSYILLIDMSVPTTIPSTSFMPETKAEIMQI
jgi:hypothetical protein